MIGCSGNMSLPGTCNFIGEYYMFCGLIFSYQFLLLTGCAVASYACTFYSSYLFVQVSFGNPVEKLKFWSNITSGERIIYYFLSFGIIFLGFFPKILIDLFLNNIALHSNIHTQWLGVGSNLKLHDCAFIFGTIFLILGFSVLSKFSYKAPFLAKFSLFSAVIASYLFYIGWGTLGCFLFIVLFWFITNYEYFKENLDLNIEAFQFILIVAISVFLFMI